MDHRGRLAIVAILALATASLEGCSACRFAELARATSQKSTWLLAQQSRPQHQPEQLLTASIWATRPNGPTLLSLCSSSQGLSTAGTCWSFRSLALNNTGKAQALGVSVNRGKGTLEALVEYGMEVLPINIQVC